MAYQLLYADDTNSQLISGRRHHLFRLSNPILPPMSARTWVIGLWYTYTKAIIPRPQEFQTKILSPQRKTYLFIYPSTERGSTLPTLPSDAGTDWYSLEFSQPRTRQSLTIPVKFGVLRSDESGTVTVSRTYRISGLHGVVHDTPTEAKPTEAKPTEGWGSPSLKNGFSTYSIPRNRNLARARWRLGSASD